MNCPECKNILPDDAKFCVFCGRSVTEEKKCPLCGTAFKEDFRFCPNCGCSSEKTDKPFERRENSVHHELKQMKLIGSIIGGFILFGLMQAKVFSPLMTFIIGMTLLSFAIADWKKKKMDDPSKPQVLHPPEVRYLGYSAIGAMIAGAIILPVLFAPLAVFLGILAVRRKNIHGWWGIIGGGIEIIMETVWDFL